MIQQDPQILEDVFDQANRADPYPLFAKLREKRVTLQHVEALSSDDVYFVSRHHDVSQLLKDPRVTTDRNGLQHDPHAQVPETVFFDQLDGPEHHRRRANLMRNFGPPCQPGFVANLGKDIERIVHAAIDRMEGETEIDIVEAFAYPVPVDVICKMLGVPPEDESKFHKWSEEALSPLPRNEPTETQKAAQKALAEYMGGLIAQRRKKPEDDFISALIRSQDDTGMSDEFIVLSGVGLLVAGHETTVNLLANGILLLLRNPHLLDELRSNPDLIIPAVEEILRLEPPSQLSVGRRALEAIEIGGVTIPKGAAVGLSIAGANRDPDAFDEPDAFRLDRPVNGHVTFGGGAHFCFGAPLARLEGQIGLRAFIERVEGARLLQDPPPYRESPILRGPSALRIGLKGIRPRQQSAVPSGECGRARHQQGSES